MEFTLGIVLFVELLAGYAPRVYPRTIDRNYTGLRPACEILKDKDGFVVPNRAGFYLLGPLQLYESPDPGSPAEKAGFKKGDIIRSFGGRWYGNPNQYLHALSLYRPGATVAYLVERDGKRFTLELTLEEREPERRDENGRRPE